MVGSQPWDALADERLYRQNANLASNVSGYLTMFETAMIQMVEWCRELGLDPEKELGGLLEHTEVLAGWTRANAMAGSKQLVEMAMGQHGTSLEGGAVSPSLRPAPPPTPGNNAVVIYDSAKDLGRDVRRKRWSRIKL